MELKINEENEFLRSILNSIFDEIMILDLNYTIIDVNKTFCTKYKVTKEETIGKKCYKLTHNSNIICRPPKCKCPVEDVLKTGDFSESIHCHIVNNRKIYLEQLAYPIKSKDGNIKQIVKIGRDITQQKKVENMLRASEKRYYDAYNSMIFYKDLFIHDISNILQNIQLSMDFLSFYQKKGRIMDDIEEIVHIVKENINRGSKIISNIRKLSDIEEFKGILVQTEVVEILEDSIQKIKTKFKNKRIEVEIVPSNKKFWINANELLFDVFENILENSVVHNTNPIIEIIIKIDKLRINNTTYLKLEFIDNGNGIPEGLKEKIFQRVDNLDKNETRIGLGLSLVKKIIDKYKGQIWIENKIKNDFSKGSNFIILIEETYSSCEKDRDPNREHENNDNKVFSGMIC
ncbi:MAG: ATP-binding protein [Promethearchaeota archaeon]